VTELAACGFDFHTNLGTIAERFPPVPNWGNEKQPVVCYPLLRPFAGLASEYKISLHDDLDRLRPASYWFAEFQPTMDVDGNFALAVRALSALLGPGSEGDASNTKEREWRIGCFRIRAIAWPRQLNRKSTNVYEGKNPYLWISANIYVESLLPRIERTEDYDLASLRSKRLLPELVFRPQSPHYSYRNSLALESSLGEGESYCLLDESHLRIVVRETTFLIPRGEIVAVELGVARPARGGGYWEIALHTQPVGGRPYRFAIHLTYGRRGEGREAEKLARALGVPLQESEWLDD
jgi:hypothetical protein